jgi:predicted methyltransferase
MMAEKDKLIVVKDTPFRDWYNTNTYKIKLMNTTKTLEQAKNKDRELWYNKVKALIYNK